MNLFPRVSLRGLHQENKLNKLVKVRGLYTWYTETLQAERRSTCQHDFATLQHHGVFCPSLSFATVLSCYESGKIVSVLCDHKSKKRFCGGTKLLVKIDVKFAW